MFFLIRMAFWLALVVLLLPLGLRGESGQDVSVVDAFGAVQSVVSDARGFCERQPQACIVGHQMFTHLLEKAQVGAKWLYEAVGEPQKAPDGATPPQSVPPDQSVSQDHRGLEPSAMPSSGQLELTPQDLLPAWGGGASLQSVPAAVPAHPGAPLPPRRPA